MWSKVAAGFTGLLLVSGIAFATITIVRQQHPTTGNTNVETPLRSLQKAKTAPAPTDTTVAKPQAKAGMRQFVDVSAGEILKEIAAYYGMKEETSSRQAANTRLYFNWNKQYNVEQVVEQLNQFEHIHITRYFSPCCSWCAQASAPRPSPTRFAIPPWLTRCAI